MVYGTVSVIGNRSYTYFLRYNVRFRKFGIKYVGFYPKQRGTLKQNDNKFPKLYQRNQ